LSDPYGQHHGLEPYLPEPQHLQMIKKKKKKNWLKKKKKKNTKKRKEKIFALKSTRTNMGKPIYISINALTNHTRTCTYH
jgi:hypothetical protein